ncbi:hypothetical protein BDW66DRAFT_145195 [Aspergillus desertorum]
MPFTSSYSLRSSGPHLSDIISLYPEDERSCAGYAASRGRRCQISTSAQSRTSAMTLLNRATKSLHAGQLPAKDLLVDLAQYALCKRFHQNQAEGLAEKWRREIERFMNGDAGSEPQELDNLEGRAEKLLADIERGPSRAQGRRVLTLRSISSVPTTPAQAPSWTRFASALSRLEASSSIISATNSLSVGAFSSALAAMPASTITTSPRFADAAQRRAENQSRMSATETTAREEEGRQSSSAYGNEETTDSSGSSARRSLGGSHNTGTHEAVGTTRAITQLTTGTMAMSRIGTEVAASHLRSSSIDSAELSRSRSVSPSISSSRATTGPTWKVATRRTVEGDCGICFEPLRKTSCVSGFPSCSNGEENISTAGPAAPDREVLGRVNSTTHIDSEGEVASESDELSWCKTHCGVNYHTTCIRLWLAKGPASTCPTCRGIWRDEPTTEAGVA